MLIQEYTVQLIMQSLTLVAEEARRLADAGGLYVNDKRVESATLDIDHFVEGLVCVLRAGKKNYSLVKLKLG